MSQRTSNRAKKVIGLIGGVGSGKSEAARIMASLGALVIDSDRLGHDVLREPEVIQTLRDWWGEGVLGSDGAIDRKALGRLVFSDPERLAKLEGLVHPRIEERRAEIMDRHAEDSTVRFFVLDAPKLIEAGLQRLCDAIVFVDADDRTRRERVRATRGWNEAEWRRREASQLPLDEKRAIADHVLTNQEGVERLRADITRMLDTILSPDA